MKKVVGYVGPSEVQYILHANMGMSGLWSSHNPIQDGGEVVNVGMFIIGFSPHQVRGWS